MRSNRVKIIHSIQLSLVASLLGACMAPTATSPTKQSNFQAIAPAAKSHAESGQAIAQAPNQTVVAEGQTLTCETTNYFAEVTRNQNQPNLKFGSRPASVTLNTQADESRNQDGSTTYTNIQGDTNTSARFDPSGSCTLRVRAANGTVTVNETGQTRQTGGSSNEELIKQQARDACTGQARSQGLEVLNIESTSVNQTTIGVNVDLGLRVRRKGATAVYSVRCGFNSNNPTQAVIVGDLGSGTSPGNPQRYQEGYDRGYQQGYQDGRNARLNNSGYNPNQGSQTGDKQYDRGFDDGFFQGFDEGYNSVTAPPAPQPPTRPGVNGYW